MHAETSIEIAAPAATIWTALTDIESWPSWTASTTRAQLLDNGPLTLGSRARLHQPRLPAAIWTVTDMAPGTAFTWRTHTPGVTTTGTHELHPLTDTTTLARLTIDQTGPLSALVALFTTTLTRRYIALEADGLKHHSERLAGEH